MIVPLGNVGSRQHWFTIAAVLLFVGFTTANRTVRAADWKPETYRVGVARADITPEYPIRLSGFGFRRTESEGVTQKIWAKALAIARGDETPVVVITVDNLGVPAWLVDQLSERLQAKVKLPRDRLAVCASHTHTGPMLKTIAPTLFGQPIPVEQQDRIDRYTVEFLDHLERVALAAIRDAQPATLHWGVGTVTFAKNRRSAGGPTDHDLPLLAVRGQDGRLRAVWLNYACHCVTLSNNKISGDWAGSAMEAIERDSPGVVALIAIGCGADQNPASGVTGDKVDVAAAQGTEIATEVRRMLGGYLAPLRGPITSARQSIELPLAAPPTRAEWEERAKRTDAIGYHARVQLERLARGESLRTKFDYPIVSWSFGNDLALLFLPGEVVVDYAVRLKRELDGRRLWINAYANDAPAYVPSERILREGGYEGGGAMVYYDVPAPYAPGLEQKIVDTVHAQLADKFRSPIDSSRTRNSVPPSAQQSLRAIRTKDNLAIQLVVAEPLVVDPVAIDFGPDGRLWVAEMHDYPTGLSGNFEPGGRVRVLRDTNGDGVFDESSIYADKIPFPTGLTVWRDGVLICAAPDILWARDTDGDDHADSVVKLFSGFGAGNFQGRVNSLEYGLDGWVYGSCGLFGGEIATSTGTTPLKLGDRDFRMLPDRAIIEPATGRTQQSRVRDDWGNWFGCDNSNLCRHYPLAENYLRRNPYVTPPPAGVNVADAPDSHRLFPLQQQAQRFKLSGPPNGVTAACGLGIYRDDWLGSDFTGNAFVCEPVNLVVHRLTLNPRDSSFSGRRPPDELDREFLASTDNWFRPVQVRTGPDGALWVVDMCRYLIEHPRWIPPEDLERIDVRAGSTLGRIYRLTPRDASPRALERLDQLELPELVKALDTSNGTRRDLAAQLLLWKLLPNGPEPDGRGAIGASDARTAEVVERLDQLCASSKRAATRVQALSLLGVLGRITPAQLDRALVDSDAGVRRHAVRLTEPKLSTQVELLRRVVALVDDPDAQVRLQVALSLGQTSDSEANAALARLALGHPNDPYLIAAVLSSLRRDNAVPVVEQVLAAPSPPESLVARLLAVTTALSADEQLSRLISRVVTTRDGQFTAWQWSAAAGIAESLARQTRTLQQLVPAADRPKVEAMLAAAERTARDASAPEADRIAALGLFVREPGRRDADLALLAELLVPQNSVAVQSAALAAMGRRADPAVPQIVTRNWNRLTPGVQSQVLELLLSRPAWQVSLVSILESNAVAPSQIHASTRQRLLATRDANLRARVEKLFASATDADRQKVIDTFHVAITMSGDRARGATLFAKHCAACHRWGELGHAVGPDLAALANKTPLFLLTEMLDPNRNVDSRYTQYVAVTNDGRTFTGVLASESATSVTLRGQEGKQFELLRGDLDQLQSTGKSLMPVGLEKDLAAQDFADLLALLVGAEARPKPKNFPGNAPAVVTPIDGRFALRATQAEIYGNEIVFEQPFRNIGYWHGLQDYVSWAVRAEQGGEFDVYLDYACDAASAGNQFALDAGAASLRGVVAATGGWDQYRQVKVGTLTLAAGAPRVTVRPDGTLLRGALFDLRGVHFVPRGTPLPRNAWNTDAPVIPSDNPQQLAAALLDDRHSSERRQAAIQEHPDWAAELIAAMTSDLMPGTKEEYRRIPWIWRVAIAAGKRNDAESLRRVLGVSLPPPGQPLRDWQAVVLGGGIINGISQRNEWPRTRIDELLREHPKLAERWSAALEQAAAMADNEQVPTGTRYDALRMIALEGWTKRGAQLERYLARGIHDELQMGAISGASDIDAPEVAARLIAGMAWFSPNNRRLAREALQRTEARKKTWQEAVDSGRVPRE